MPLSPPPPPPKDAPPGSSLARLVAVMDALLAPDGCPWDREQTLDTLKPFLIEETYEVLDAMDHAAAEHCEELGDLLMQIVFQAALRRGAFTIDDVVEGICEKLIRRHPHVFGDASASTPEQVLAQWEEIKKAEKAERNAKKAAEAKRVLGGVPKGLPALARAQALGTKAGRVGFDWPGPDGSLAKVREEVEEIAEAITANDRAAAHHELGDLLFATVNLARKLDVDAETALRDASARFTARFEFIEDRLAERGKTPEQSNLEEMDGLWDEAKRLAVTPPRRT
jgi:MazG family protein